MKKQDFIDCRFYLREGMSKHGEKGVCGYDNKICGLKNLGEICADFKKMKVVKYQHFKHKEALQCAIMLSGWGHVKGNNIYIGRHRARCNYKLFGDKEICGTKMDLDNCKYYASHLKKIYCSICTDIKRMDEFTDKNTIVIETKKSVEQRLMDMFIKLDEPWSNPD